PASDGQGAELQVVHTDVGGSGTGYGAISIKPGGDVRVTTGNRSRADQTHMDLMKGQFGAKQAGERRFGIEGGMGGTIVTKTSGATGFPTQQDLPAIQAALSKAGR